MSLPHGPRGCYTKTMRTTACLIFILAAGFPVRSSAAGPTDPPQTILLQDGSILKGRLISADARHYVIRTEGLGDITVRAEDVVSISRGSPSTLPATSPAAGPPLPIPASIPGLGPMQQQQILADPEIKALMMEIARDPHLAQLLRDPQFLQSVFQMDVQAVQNAPQTKELLQDPRMQELIERIMQKIMLPGTAPLRQHP